MASEVLARNRFCSTQKRHRELGQSVSCLRRNLFRGMRYKGYNLMMARKVGESRPKYYDIFWSLQFYTSYFCHRHDGFIKSLYADKAETFMSLNLSYISTMEEAPVFRLSNISSVVGLYLNVPSVE